MSLNATRLESVRHVFLSAMRSQTGNGASSSPLERPWIGLVPAEMPGVDSRGSATPTSTLRDSTPPKGWPAIIWIGVLGTILDPGARRATRPVSTENSARAVSPRAANRREFAHRDQTRRYGRLCGLHANDTN